MSRSTIRLKSSLDEAEITLHRSQLSMIWKTFQRDKTALVGASIVLFAVLISISAPLISPYGPNESDITKRLCGIGTSGHIFGLDGQGRDILSRTIWGGRITLFVSIVPVLAGASTAIFFGLLAGYYQGVIGQIIMRIVDIFFAFPLVLLAVALAAVMGAGIKNVMLTIFIVSVPYVTRVVYTAVLEVRQADYIEAAKASGGTRLSLLFGQVLPNVVSPAIVYVSTCIALFIVISSGLSFLGLGVQPPTADWGVMCSDGRSVMTVAPHVAAIPGTVILIVAISFNLLGDGLRDALNPMLKTR